MTETALQPTQTPQSDAACLSAKASLFEAFGVEFQLWKPNELPGESTTSTPPTGLELVRRVTQPGSEPGIVAVGDDRWLLALPLIGEMGAEFIATAQFETNDPNLLGRLALQFAQQYTLNSRLDVLNEDGEDLVRQIACDMEELSFLRLMAENLALSGRTLDAKQLAENVLPTLREHIHAEGVVYCSSGMDHSAILVGRPVVTIGQVPLDGKGCTRLVERFREPALQQPVIRNHCDTLEEFADMPGLRSFLLVPMQRGRHVYGWLVAFNRNGSSSSGPDDVAGSSPWHLSRHEFGTGEAMLLRSTGLTIGTHASNIRLIRDREQMLVDMVQALVHAIEAKDRYTFGHSERVALYARQIGAAMGLKDSICKRIHLAGLLHDVGKIATRDDVLTKPGKLTDEQFDVMKQHPDKGWSILQGLDALDDVLAGVLYHHERWDGKGYPDGLAGEAIPLDSRILSVADAFDAMTSSRPYRNAMPLEKATEILRQGSGSQWDPHIVATFFDTFVEILRIRDDHQVRQPKVRQRHSLTASGEWDASKIECAAFEGMVANES